MSEAAAPRPDFVIGQLVEHTQFGRGKIMGYDGENYVVLGRDGDVRRFRFGADTLQAVDGVMPGDPQIDLIKAAVAEVLDDWGVAAPEFELARRWRGGTMKLVPGREGTQEKDIPLEQFFKKLISVRDKLRVLEQKINGQDKLEPEEKLDLQGYITRAYGSLTSFNVLFGEKVSQFRGMSGKG